MSIDACEGGERGMMGKGTVEEMAYDGQLFKMLDTVLRNTP